MIFLPIVGRELRVAARRQGTYFMRLFVALAAILVGIFLYIANNEAPRQTVAHRIFEGLSVLALIYCLASGRRSTADCLSEEKREGTLGLLFLTKLKGYDVMFGKLAATSLNGFFCLLAMFPVIALPLLMGGITNGEFWRMVLVLLNTFLFSLAVGMFSSVLSWNARRAMGANFLWLLVIAAGLPACAGLIAYLSPTHRVIPELLYSCPIYTFYLSADAVYRWQISNFWLSAATIHALTWLLLLLSSRFVVNSWQDRPTGERKALMREFWQRLAYGSGERRKALRRRLLPVNAFYWLCSRAWLKPLGVWVALLFVAGWWSCVRFVMGFKWFDPDFCLMTAFLPNLLLKLWLGVEACQRLAEDQKMGAMELLLSTPMTVGDILRGQLLALNRQFLKPILLVIALQVFLICYAPGRSFQLEPEFRAWQIAFLVFFIADLAALACLAMSNGLISRNPNFASVSTIFKLLILPMICFAALSVLGSVWSSARGSQGPGWQYYLAIWCATGLAADLAYGVPAWRGLRLNFRELALRRLNRAMKQV